MKKRNVRRANLNTMFHAVITLKNGFHKVIRLSRYVIGHICFKYHEMQRDIFGRQSIVEISGCVLILNDIKEIKFVYENSREEFLTLSM